MSQYNGENLPPEPPITDPETAILLVTPLPHLHCHGTAVETHRTKKKRRGEQAGERGVAPGWLPPVFLLPGGGGHRRRNLFITCAGAHRQRRGKAYLQNRESARPGRLRGNVPIRNRREQTSRKGNRGRVCRICGGRHPPASAPWRYISYFRSLCR